MFEENDENSKTDAMCQSNFTFCEKNLENKGLFFNRLNFSNF